MKEKSYLVYMFFKRKEEYVIKRISNNWEEILLFDKYQFQEILEDNILFITWINFFSSSEVIIDIFISYDYTIEEENKINEVLEKYILKDKRLWKDLVSILESPFFLETDTKWIIKNIIKKIKGEWITSFSDLKDLCLLEEEYEAIIYTYLVSLFKKWKLLKVKQEKVKKERSKIKQVGLFWPLKKTKQLK